MIKLILFSSLSLVQKKMILEWRNHSKIKKWMYESKEISLKNHLLFIESLKNEKCKKYFLVQKNGIEIGVISFVNITQNDTLFGLYTNPALKGYGSILLEEVIKYAFKILNIKKLQLEVFSSNNKAISLYEKHGFYKFNKKIVKNQDVICMEIKNENR